MDPRTFYFDRSSTARLGTRPGVDNLTLCLDCAETLVTAGRMRQENVERRLIDFEGRCAICRAPFRPGRARA